MPDDRPRTFSAMFIIPQESTAKKVWFFYTWPIQLLLTTLVPSPKVHRKLYPLTFVLCILLIGANSYLVYWMVAIIGHTISIPESVMGMTLLAGGGCLPEAISCVILIRRGELTDGFLIQWQCIRCGVWLPDKTIPLSSLSLSLSLPPSVSVRRSGRLRHIELAWGQLVGDLDVAGSPVVYQDNDRRGRFHGRPCNHPVLWSGVHHRLLAARRNHHVHHPHLVPLQTSEVGGWHHDNRVCYFYHLGDSRGTGSHLPLGKCLLDVP